MNRPTTTSALGLALSLTLATTGCTSAAAPADAGADGALDGSLDAAPPTDSGTDAPYVAADLGPPVPGLHVSAPCADVAAALYATPAGLPPFTADVRGALLGCAHLERITADQLRTRLAGVPDAVVTGDVESYLIAYRTEREPRGVGGISTALVYVPDATLGMQVPMVLAAHGSVGLDDHCAPSHLIHDPTSFLPASYVDALFLSWAARGLPVVAPDYAGLGTDGVHDYSNWFDPARSAVDGVRALRAILPADRLDGTTLVYGHSQGGGIALTVAALEAEAPDVHLRAVVAFAPGYRSIALVSALRLSTVPLTAELRGVASFAAYAGLANLTTDATHWGDAFAPAVRDHIVSEVSTLCYAEELAALDTPSAGYTPPATVGELVDPTFVAGVVACADTGACTGLPGAFAMRDAADEPHLAAGSPPVLILGSSTDEQVSTGQLGCAIRRVAMDGASPDVCIITGQSHLGMVSATSSYGSTWALAASTGAPRPPCTGATRTPPCVPF